MDRPDDPQHWLPVDPASFCTWNAGLLGNAQALSFVPNYRYYIGAGLDHTLLRDKFVVDEFETEDSGGVAFTNWLAAMIQGPKKDWNNAQCEDCAPPFDPLVCSSL